MGYYTGRHTYNDSLYSYAAQRGITEAQVDEIIDAGDHHPSLGAKNNMQYDRVRAGIDELVAGPVVEDVPVEQVEPRASERQVAYIANLLAAKVLSGDGAGIVSIERFTDGVVIHRDEILALSQREASLLIDSLRENY